MRVGCVDTVFRSLWVEGWFALPLRYDRQPDPSPTGQHFHVMLGPGGEGAFTNAGRWLFRANNPPAEVFVLVADQIDPDAWQAYRYRLASGWLCDPAAGGD